MDRYGIDKCIEMALDHIDPGNNRDFHISFDIDALDPIQAPCTGVPGNYNKLSIALALAPGLGLGIEKFQLISISNLFASFSFFFILEQFLVD